MTASLKRAPAMLAVLAVLVGGLATNPAISDEGDDVQVFKGTGVKSTRTVRDLPDSDDSGGRSGEVNQRRTHRSEDSGASDEAPVDPLVGQRASSRASTSQILNVKGLKGGKVVPPDTVGEAGTTHFVEMVNHAKGTEVGVYDKITGKKKKKFILSKLAAKGSPCSLGTGDPIPIFDQVAGRWLLTELHDVFSTGLNRLCIYVSSGADPLTSSWFVYAITTPDFPDYPKYGMIPTESAYYIGTNEDFPSDTSAVYALDRTAMLANAPTITILRGTTPDLAGFGFQLLVPVDLDGPTPPPAGTRGIFVRHVDDESHSGAPDGTKDFLQIFEVDPDFPGLTGTFGLVQTIDIAEFDSDLCGLFSFTCVPQPGTFQELDPLREPIMHRPTLRVFGGGTPHQSLVGSFVTDVDDTDHHGVRWFELTRAAAATTAGWSLLQEGTVAPDVHHRWMSSIAMNGAGEIALGYSVSSSTVFPSIRYTGRLPGDTAGTMTVPETTIVAGERSQTLAERWGDYSAMSVDPSDDETFWYVNEFSKGKAKWQTQIAKFTVSP